MHHHAPERIDAQLKTAAAPAAGRVHWFAQIDSTNTWLLNHADAHARVCLAEWQSAGRGRRGRAWQAAASGAVLLSIGWDLRGADAAGLSLVSGLAVVAALREMGVNSARLKWPNDVLVGDAKLGGILTELSGGLAVIGMGVNVKLPPPIAPGRADLASLGCAVGGDFRDRLAAELIIAHGDYLRRFCAAGLADFVDEWNALHAHRDRRVAVESPGESPTESFCGIARGIDQSGALIVEQDGRGDNLRRIISAQASVRATA